MASNVATLKHKNFIACTDEELEAVRRIMARLRLTPPRRKTRRSKGGASAGASPTCAARSARPCVRRAS